MEWYCMYLAMVLEEVHVSPRLRFAVMDGTAFTADREDEGTAMCEVPIYVYRRPSMFSL